MACECATCKLSRKIQALRPTWTSETKDIVDELWARMEWAETDSAALEAKLSGT